MQFFYTMLGHVRSICIVRFPFIYSQPVSPFLLCPKASFNHSNIVRVSILFQSIAAVIVFNMHHMKSSLEGSARGRWKKQKEDLELLNTIVCRLLICTCPKIPWEHNVLKWKLFLVISEEMLLNSSCPLLAVWENACHFPILAPISFMPGLQLGKNSSNGGRLRPIHREQS